MKKIIICIIIFAILAIGFTAIMINIKTKNVGFINKTTSSENKEQNTSFNVEEKTIDLYSTYDENDIQIYDITIDIEDVEEPIRVKQIKGLKNKDVESNINNKIKEKAITNLASIDKSVEKLTFYSSVEGNFGNILSLNSMVQYRIDDKYYSYGYTDTYELVNGNELKIEDVFSKKTNLDILIKKFIYKQMARDDKGSYLFGGQHSEPYYDSEQGIWLATYYIDEYNGNNGERKGEVREYIPAFSDYEIEKMTKQIIANKNSFFSISPEYIFLNVIGQYNVYGQYGNFKTSISMRDIVDNVVIYNKYLSKESIYENDDIGADNILTCVNRGSDPSFYRETKFESSNLFYNIENRLISDEQYPSEKYKNEKESEIREKINKEIEEYKKIANENKQKAYFLFLDGAVEGGSYYTEFYDELRGKKEGSYEYNNLFSTELNECIISCDINNKSTVMKEILSCFYTCYDVYNTVSNEIVDRNLKNIATKDEIRDKHFYDVYTGNEINNLKELFINPEKMNEILKNALQNTQFNYIDLSQDIYADSFNTSDIFINGKSTYNSMTDASSSVSFRSIEKYTIVKPLKEFVFVNSSVMNLTRNDLVNLDKTELYRAYNEIFARHGHDFKMKEYQHYFNLWDWYHPISGKTVSLEELTNIEKENVQLIKSVIDEK